MLSAAESVNSIPVPGRNTFYTYLLAHSLRETSREVAVQWSGGVSETDTSILLLCR